MKCAVYARVSSDEQETSIINQQEYFKEYIKRHNYEMYGVYSDEAFSGTEISKRRDFLRLLEDGKNRRYDVLLAKSYSRFGRNQRETLSALAELFENGIRIIFVEDGLDSLRDKGQFGLFAWLAEQEARKISERIKLTWQIYNQQGKIHNTKETYGYNYNREIRNFEVNEKEAEIVRLIYEKYLQGDSLRTIAVYLNNKGYPTKQNSMWFSKVLKVMLQNEFYLGHLTQGRHKKIDVTIKKVESVNKKDWYVHKNNHTAIIPEELFNKVQVEMARRSENIKGDNPARYSAKHLFSNLIKCKICGQSFIHRKRAGSKLSYYACTAYCSLGIACGHRSNRISERRMADIIKEKLQAFAENDFEAVKDFYKRQGITTEAENISISEIETQIEEQTRLSLSLLDVFSNGMLGKNQFKLQNDAIEEKINTLIQKKEELTNHTTVNDNTEEEAIKTIKETLAVDVSQWDNFLIKNIIKKIHLDMIDDYVEIIFNYGLEIQ
ncbi:MAG: recombinase family protein [Defluviitaleaceae bacterium]|nr:recombinase family protein [Defluviitaleaceae bacterium]